MFALANGYFEMPLIVNKKIKEGYQPFGAAFTELANDGVGKVYIQPMVKYEEEKPIQFWPGTHFERK